MEAKKWVCEALDGSKGIFIMNEGMSEASSPVYHDFTMLVYTAHGEGTHNIGGKSIPITEGDIFIVNPSTTHYFRRSERARYLELYYCLISPEKAAALYAELKPEFPELSSFFDNSFTHFIHTKDSDGKEIRNIFVRMIDEFTQSAPGSQSLVNSCLTTIVIKIFRRYLHSINNPVYNRNPAVDHIIRYINYNLNYGVSLADIADAFHLSEEYICRLFKKHTGTTVKQYIIGLRIEKAKDLLKNTDRSIESIAVSLNCNQVYLNRLFKKHTGMTLLAYRKKYYYKS